MILYITIANEIFYNSYIQNILIDACKNPSLIQLFHLYSYFPTVEALENVRINIFFLFIFRLLLYLYI